VLAEFEPLLKKLNPEFSRNWVVGAWQFVAPNAQPVVTPGFRKRPLPLRTPLAGLYAANLFQVYPHDRGQSYAVELAEAAVRGMLADARA
jgi:hypothetical protein